MLISLIKVKKLYLSEMKKLYDPKSDAQIDGVYASMIQNQKTEIKILSSIVKSEEEK